MCKRDCGRLLHVSLGASAFKLTILRHGTNKLADLWLMPQDCLHTTTLEITHSKTREEIEELVAVFGENARPIADYPAGHRTRLIKPVIGFDASAIALSFVPVAGEGLNHDRTASSTLR